MIEFIYGQNLFEINNRLKKIEAEFAKIDSSGINLEKLDGTELVWGKFEQAVSAMPFLAEKRLVIIKNLLIENKDNELKTKIGEYNHKVSLKTDTGGKNSTDIVFVEMGEPDKRLKLFKDLIKYAKVSEARQYQGEELVRRVQSKFKTEEIAASNNNCQFLISEVGSDMQRLSSEIAKISLHIRSQNRRELKGEDIELLSCPEIDPNIFQFTEAISRRDAKNASRLLYELGQKGENEQKILGTLAFQLRTLIIIRDAIDRGISSRELASLAKIAPFVINKNLNIAKGRPLKSFIAMYDQLRRTECAIKSGEIAPDMAVDILVTTLCK